MRSALLILFAILLVVGIGAGAWWARQAAQPLSHTVASGETLANVAMRYGVTPSELAEANELGVDKGIDTLKLPIGTALSVPRHAATQRDVMVAYGIGLLAEVGGLLVAYILALMVGILARRRRRQALSLAILVGLVSYVITVAARVDAPPTVPALVSWSLRDGFTCAGLIVMFSGLIDRPARPAPPAPPPPAAEEPAP